MVRPEAVGVGGALQGELRDGLIGVGVLAELQPRALQAALHVLEAVGVWVSVVLVRLGLVMCAVGLWGFVEKHKSGSQYVRDDDHGLGVAAHEHDLLRVTHVQLCLGLIMCQ